MGRKATNSTKKTAFRQRIDELHMTQTELAKRTGKSITLINHFCVFGIKTLRIAQEFSKVLMCTPLELMDLAVAEELRGNTRKAATPYMLTKQQNEYQEFTDEIEKIIESKATEVDEDGKLIGATKAKQKEMLLALYDACEKYGVPVNLMLAITRISAMCDMSVISNILLSDRKVIAMLDRVAYDPMWWRVLRMHLFNPEATHAEIGQLLGLSREKVTQTLKKAMIRDADFSDEYYVKR